MLAVARTFTLLGIDAGEVSVEVDVHRGLPAFSIVGLPDAAVRESRERVRAALVNSGFDFPLKRITANLAPADLRKVGPGFDLAIAAALLAASGQLDPACLTGFALAGELALDGSIRPVPGALAMAEGARRIGMRGIGVAAADAPEAALADPLEVIPLCRLEQVPHLANGLPRAKRPAQRIQAAEQLPDLADLRGQPALRRALEIAAAGGHSLLMTGPPGSGKTLAARRLASIMPPLGWEEALEVTRIASACGRGRGGALISARPFRAPHHTVSAAGLVGGGRPPRAGEVTLAHRGVLFLDELGEFRRQALEALRQPLEEGSVTISRAARSLTLPCRFMLVAAANPCPCGHGRDSGRCECPHQAVRAYAAKLSGALADRIDISLGVGQPSSEALAGEDGEGSEAVRQRVAAARERAAARLGAGRCNAELDAAETRAACRMTRSAVEMLSAGRETLGLSARGWDRAARVARTIADLADRERVTEEHVGEALTLRRKVER
ncbi:MAG: YifB family Mg chelatase-like AAA ATPase [Solirubrobacterales bacterium]